MVMEILVPASIPSLEGVMHAVADAVTSGFTDASALVAQLSPGEDAPLDPPAAIQLVAADYAAPVAFPTLIIGGSNLHRTGQPGAVRGGEWSGEIELHLWAQDGDPTRLARTLQRQAATLWTIITSADMQRALAGAVLLPETLAITPFSDPAQSVAQQSVAMRFNVNLRA